MQFRMLVTVLALLASLDQLAAQQVAYPSDPATQSSATILNTRPTFPALSIERRASGTERVKTQTATPSLSGPAITVASSLAVVLGLFAGVVYLSRRFGNGHGGNKSLSRDAVEVLGCTHLDPRVKLSLVRIGGRVIVLAQSPTGIHPVSEISDPNESQRLVALCRNESSQSFAKELQAIEKEPFKPGFVEPAAETPPRSRHRLFATA